MRLSLPQRRKLTLILQHLDYVDNLEDFESSISTTLPNGLIIVCLTGRSLGNAGSVIGEANMHKQPCLLLYRDGKVNSFNNAKETFLQGVL